MYVVVSEDEGVILHYLDATGSEAVIERLEENMQEKTWDTLIKVMYEAEEYQASRQ